jgi:hypothetical protein
MEEQSVSDHWEIERVMEGRMVFHWGRNEVNGVLLADEDFIALIPLDVSSSGNVSTSI